jgi:RHS repeat-associated protein
VSSQPDLVSGDCVGQYTDPTGLIYLRARYYDPSTGQFLTIDPDVDSTRTPYAYTAGNPLNATDPSGLHGPAISPISLNFWTKGNIFSDPVQRNLACGNSLTSSLVMAYDPVYGGLQSYSSARDQGNSISASLVMSADPAYGAITHGTAAVDDFNQGRYAAAAGEAGQSALDTASTVAVATGIGTGWGATAAEDGAGTTALLQAHVDAATQDFESGAIGMSRAQARAAADNPGLAKAFRGSVIDSAAKARVAADPALSHVYSTPNFTFGADFFDASGNWWDMTTEGQWQAHVSKYEDYFGGPGVRLSTG